MERRLAKEIAKKHGTNSPWIIARELGADVRLEDLGKNIWGYYTRVNRVSCICINSKLDPVKANFACNHELGHLILHPDSPTPFLRRNTLFSVDKLEWQANRFATYLWVGLSEPETWETKQQFLFRCGLPKEFHVFY